MNKNIEVNLIIMIFRENVLLLPATRGPIVSPDAGNLV
jgi:hypothetical protein